MDFHNKKGLKATSSLGSSAGDKRKFSNFAKPSPDRYYLVKTTSSLRGNARKEISRYGIIQNVLGDGNCGIYASMEGLRKAGIKCTLDVNTFRKNVYDYIIKNIKNIVPQLTFSRKKMASGTMRGKTREQFIKTEILDRIWNKQDDFSGYCDESHWVHSSLHLPIFAEMFGVNFVWFDINNEKTHGYVLIQKKNQQHGQIQEQRKHGYISPSIFVEKSVWKKSVVMLYHNSHYQHVQLY